MITASSLGQYLLDQREHTDRLLQRIATCTDVVQLHEAHTVALLFGLPGDVVCALDDKIARLTGVRATEQPVSLSSIGDGAADEYLQDAMRRLQERVEAKGAAEGEATLTYKVSITCKGGGFIVVIPQPDLKLPALAGRSSIVRVSASVDGDVLVMDRAEDSDGNRQLPFNLRPRLQ